MPTASEELARAVAATVPDPELPILTLDDLGVLRDVRVEIVDRDGCPGERIVVTITPTYSGCPAMATIRADLLIALRRNGFDAVEVRTSLEPAWSSDWIGASGRRKLTEAGIAPPGPAPRPGSGPVPLSLQRRRDVVLCPRCGSPDTVPTSWFGSTACKSLYRCRSCAEPFDRFKEL